MFYCIHAGTVYSDWSPIVSHCQQLQSTTYMVLYYPSLHFGGPHVRPAAVIIFYVRRACHQKPSHCCLGRAVTRHSLAERCTVSTVRSQCRGIDIPRYFLMARGICTRYRPTETTKGPLQNRKNDFNIIVVQFNHCVHA